MFVAVQMSAASLGALLTEGMKRVDLCVTDQFDGFVVDHIALGTRTQFAQGAAYVATIPVSGGTPHSVSAHALSFSQDITVFVASIPELVTSGPGPSLPQAIPLTITFDLRLSVIGGSTAITLAYQSVSPLVPDPRVDQLDNLLRNRLPPRSQGLDLVALVDGLGLKGNPAHAGAAWMSDSSIIEFRVEITSTAASDNLLAWEGFYTDGPGPDLTRGDDWAVWVDVEGVKSSMSKVFGDGLQANGSFTLDSGIDIAWQPGEPPRLVVTFNGDALDACTCLWGKIDVNVDVTVTITFSIDQDQIRYDVNVDHSSNQLQLFCCELTAALFWPIIGGTLLADGKISLGKFIGGLLGGPLLVFVAAIVAASEQGTPIPSDQLKGTCTKDSDTDVHCFVTIPSGTTPASVCDAPSIERRVPTHLYGTSAAPNGVLPGKLVITGSDTIRSATQPSLDCLAHEFEWRFPEPTCSSLDGTLAMVASVQLQASGDIPLRFCDAVAIGDTAAQYQPFVSVSYSYCPMIVTVEVAVPVGTDLGGPCQLLIWTTGGARVITFAPIPGPTPEQVQEFNLFVLRWRLETCYTKLDDWYRFFQRFNPLWLVDPPSDSIDPERLTHMWEVAVTGVLPGDRIALGGPGGEQVAVATVNAAGFARLGASISGAQIGAFGARGGAQSREALLASHRHGSAAGGGHELSIHRLRNEAHTGGSAAVDAQMLIKQILVVEQCVLLAGRGPTGVSLTFADGVATLTVSHARGVNVYDVSNAAEPRLVGQYPAHLLGAHHDRGRHLLCWDDEGVLEHHRTGWRRVAAAVGVENVRVERSGEVVVTTRMRTVIFDRDWHECDQPEPCSEEGKVGLRADCPCTTPKQSPPPTSCSRFGLVARIDHGAVSLGIIAGTRLL